MIKRSVTEFEIERNWTPLESWSGFEKGDLVHVIGTSGCEFHFVYAHEHDGVVTEVTVCGGSRGRRLLRTFTVDRVVSPNAAQRRRSVRRDGATASH